ncbi:hypothetical protein AC1031_004274 [Aphanomyces cochlioides]|nr:hypothetical protein AC1031_004274 [Aphanomyces cochlioides]
MVWEDVLYLDFRLDHARSPSDDVGRSMSGAVAPVPCIRDTSFNLAKLASSVAKALASEVRLILTSFMGASAYRIGRAVLGAEFAHARIEIAPVKGTGAFSAVADAKVSGVDLVSAVFYQASTALAMEDAFE